MKKIILVSLLFSLGLTGLYTTNVEAASTKVSAHSADLTYSKQQALAKNNLLRSSKCISMKKWNDNVLKIVTMTTEQELQDFHDYFYFVILTTPHGSVA